ncbi:hypothetical protein Tco_0827151, partial [Tanacetum coccineum]
VTRDHKILREKAMHLIGDTGIEQVRRPDNNSDPKAIMVLFMNTSLYEKNHRRVAASTRITSLKTTFLKPRGLCNVLGIKEPCLDTAAHVEAVQQHSDPFAARSIRKRVLDLGRNRDLTEICSLPYDCSCWSRIYPATNTTILSETVEQIHWPSSSSRIPEMTSPENQNAPESILSLM